MLFLFIGITAGLVMGITGGAGAVVSVPLFIYLAGIPIKSATALGLVTVFLGSSINSITQRKSIVFKFATILAMVSFFSSIWTAKIKPQTPDWTVKTLFIVICLFVLRGVWKRKPKNQKLKAKSPSDFAFYFKFTLMGLLVGITATMAGISGGLVLVPFLVSVAQLTLAKAVATSLATMALTAIGSLYFQWNTITDSIELNQLLFLSLGLIGSALLLKNLMKQMQPRTQESLRKWIFTVVLGLASISVALS